MFTPDSNARLKSGQTIGRQWEHINRLSGGAKFSYFETVAARDGMGRVPRQLRTPAGGGIVNCGEYDAARTYSINNLVVKSSGDNRGTYLYISVTPSSGHSPWLGGGYWMQLPGGPVAQWL